MAEGVIARVSKDIKKDIEFFAREEQTDKSQIIRELLAVGVKQKRLGYALDGYGKHELSLGKAAEMARLPLADFMEQAAKKGIPLTYSKNDLMRDFSAAG
ncbi:TPA: hypothetical protein HA295_02950 [Candidatus Woesearchaeota archaeon]|nr:hypothetical protein [Candidatus Woesearchaeota archaeon]HII65706.1 hypothetical protein [Candidatus Woesearchaeota archaeon]